ncbi:SH2 domain-containing protein 7-like [Myripristis murdjan]|uniref:SH2 domain-containing protein 7-like n=1 Tax=Myripristis murdjan TaxID=586833 RepID=UPI001175F621|nr:SH2 domain-containing protein 7-like [Myripristis murdjan]
MEKTRSVDLQTDTSEGSLKELVKSWFRDTQASLIMPHGNCPSWFQGFTSRKDAEDLLRDKTLGSFLIRLSDKTIGYILSYKGNDRCRHFVINQNQGGLFVISGDCQTHRSLADLIEHHKLSPIQPFGECLTSCCDDTNTGELYDVVNYGAREKSGVSVQALLTLWDKRSNCNSHQRSDCGNKQRIQEQNECPVAQPPALPPKSKAKKLTGTVSVGTIPLLQVTPQVPKRGIPLSHSLSGSLPDKTSHSSETQYAHINLNQADRVSGNTNPVQTDGKVNSDRGEDLSFNTTDTSYPGDLNYSTAPGTTYSELSPVENRSKSLPRLHKSMEDEYSNKLSSPSFTASVSQSPTPLKRVTCHTYSLDDPKNSMRHGQVLPEHPSDTLEQLKSNPLYQSSDKPRAQQGDGMYAEVSQGPTALSHRRPDDTYEQIPEGTTIQSNTYETLDDMKTKKSKSTWGKNNINWRWFLPEYKKK